MARILVVDDEIGIRELLSEILYDEGHTVKCAENAAQARELRQVFNPDLVLLDIWMPDTDGVSLLKEWASNALLTMPVIMMSGHGTIETAMEATRIGAVDFLEKPIALQKLLHTVKEYLSKGFVNRRPSQHPSILQTTDTVATQDAPMMANTHTSPMLDMPTATPHQGSSIDVMVNPAMDAPLADDRLVCSSGTILLNQSLREARDEFERIYFQYHLTQNGYSMTRISRTTGLERTNLYRKLRQLGIESRRGRSS